MRKNEARNPRGELKRINMATHKLSVSWICLVLKLTKQHFKERNFARFIGKHFA
jgi:hypothetical protein